MKDKTACFTGHRDIPPLKRPGIKHRLEREIEKSIQAGYVYFGAGGALGFDTLAAQTVLKLKGRYQDIKLILVLPCKTQTSGWKQTDKGGSRQSRLYFRSVLSRVYAQEEPAPRG